MALVKELIEIYESTRKAIVIMSHTRLKPGLEVECVQRLTQAGIPLLTDGLAAAKAVAQLAWYQDKAARVAAADEGSAPHDVVPGQDLTRAIRQGEGLSEHGSKQILERYGIPVTREALATSADMAVGLARELGYPVALKVQAPQIAHKTEADGIRLDLASDQAVRSAYGEILANAERFAPDAEVQGVLVQEMLEGGVEVIIGATKDPVFGHAIMFGLGGIFVEVLRDVSFRIAPLTRADAEEMIEEIAGHRVLLGARGRPPADREAIVDALLSVSRLVTEHPDAIAELDINPLLVFPKGAKAVDALIRA
jgi:acetyltransferase